MGDKHLLLPEVLLEELECISFTKNKCKAPESTEPSANEKKKDLGFEDVVPKLHHENLSALCLSGGGIRSATFCLGVLQGLAKQRLLGCFDYLSTVSGGGYIGSWLTSWLSRDGVSEEQVFDAIAEDSCAPPFKEPTQVRFLRDYSNYLTPRPGLLSMDTWTMLVIYLRNLFLNWLILVPLFFALLILPRFFIASLGHEHAFIITAAFFCGLPPVAYTVLDLPTVGNAQLPKTAFIFHFVVPLFAMATLLALFLSKETSLHHSAFDFVSFGCLVHFGGWLLGVCECIVWGCLADKETRDRKILPIALFGLIAIPTGALAGYIGWQVAKCILPALASLTQNHDHFYWIASFPAILLTYAIAGILSIAVLSRWTGDEDREWWGRSGAAIMVVIFSWLVLMGILLVGPWFLLPDSGKFWRYIYTSIGIVSGIATALLGKSPTTLALRPGKPPSGKTNLLLVIAGIAFLVVLMSALSFAGSLALNLHTSSTNLTTSCAVAGPFNYSFKKHEDALSDAKPSDLAYVFLLATACTLAAGGFIGINKFSMHAMYRNRLVRCYLGASRPDRKPNPFTGFDPEDNIQLTRLKKRPFHVLNMTWNLVKGKRLAWQQRKGASFTMTPLHAGSDIDPLKKDTKYPGGYRDIREYGAGWGLTGISPLTLGTAMAISGAAASPNMGYHSSPIVTFIMAFFNVRLGWWLGNPGTGMGSSWRKKSAAFSVLPLIKETLGFTSEDSSDIYLSDGGHFENLGLYEMVRRRCHNIVVCDASCDPALNFDNLGNAIRKIRVDFGIDVDIDLRPIQEKKSHFAVGHVRYSACDGMGVPNGIILYIKPVLTSSEPIDVANYHKMHGEFPHEPTSDQWFDEAQFESYRRLGLFSIEKVATAKCNCLETFIRNAATLAATN